MHKVVYNRCFGGFGLSLFAYVEILKRKGYKDFYIYEQDGYTGPITKVKKVPKKSTEKLFHYTFVLSKDYGDVIESEDTIDRDDYIELNLSRHDKDLVAVVEEFGEACNGSCADLAIKKIKSDLYRIDEYDGSEAVQVPDDIEWVKIED